MTTQTTSTNAPTSSTPTVTAPSDLRGSGPEVEAAAARLFGFDASEVEGDGEDAPAEGGEQVDAAATSETKTEPEGKTETEPALDLASLRKIAADRAKQREQRGADAVKARELETRLATLESERKADAEAAANFRKLQTLSKDSPIELLEALGIDVVPFLQSGHRQALAREGFQAKKTAEQLQAELAETKKQLAELRDDVPKRLAERETAAEAARNRREFAALTEDVGAYPLLSAESTEDRFTYASEAVKALVEAGYDQITHKLVADTVETNLRKDLERRQAALGRLSASDSSPDNKAAIAGGSPAAKGRANGSAKAQPKTISQQMASETPNGREPNQRERDLAANRLVSQIFGVPER